MEPTALWYTDWPDPVLTLSGVAGREDDPPPLYSLVASWYTVWPEPLEDETPSPWPEWVDAAPPPTTSEGGREPPDVEPVGCGAGPAGVPVEPATADAAGDGRPEGTPADAPVVVDWGRLPPVPVDDPSWTGGRPVLPVDGFDIHT
ncbi:hypothetical protein [Nocardia abscessus]|uniref:hypothetical protein n=1 Tax=Nocardia abscessus TaxID=120957 RepID=UPI002458812A|nr:hypothetical protein [Nocardia abscessus]